MTEEFAENDDLKNTLDGSKVAYHLISSTVLGDDTVDPIKELSENIWENSSFNIGSVGKKMFCSLI